jgi:IS5 family transposase
LLVRLQGVGGDSPATKPKGGQFLLQAKAPHDNPFDRYTLGP